MSTTDETKQDLDQGALLDSAGIAAEPLPGDGEHGAAGAPRVVTTGRKATPADEGERPPQNIDPDTGEPFELYARGGGGITLLRRLVPDESASPGIAQIDALAFTVVPPGDQASPWLIEEMRRFLTVDELEQRRGCFGFKFSARFGDGAGLIAWGGKSQRDRIYFSIQGKGCAMITDWPALAEWMEAHRAAVKRVDLAHDDFGGTTVSISWAVEQYEQGGFNAGGRKPKHHVHGDWLSGGESIHGRTLGVGNRASGKYCRVYEKGKQLGDPTSPWARVEVEWHGQDRVIPYAILRRPGEYLAGAYPCLHFLSLQQSRIKTVAKGGTIAFDRAVENAKLHSGKLVNLMLQVSGGDYAEVVTKLKRDGIPARIEPYSYHLRGAPERLDPESPGSFASILTTD